MPRHLTIVVDTNIWVSFLIWPSEVIRAAVGFAIDRGNIIASDATIGELSETLSKEKFRGRFSVEEKHSFCAAISHLSKIMPVNISLDVCRDPLDNIFLELALAGNAEIVITGDADLLALHPWQGISILTPRQFVEMMRRDYSC